MINQSELLGELCKNYFTLFGIPQVFGMDVSILHDNYLALQKKYHPDNFVNSVLEIKSLVLSLSSYINHAYTTLKSPILRGVYLLKLNKIELDLAKDTKLSQEFIIMQMEFHENIENAIILKDVNKLEEIENHLITVESSLIKQFDQLFNSENYEKVIDYIKQLKFYERLKNTLIVAFERVV
jgi:molecular chaperone HscB